MKGKSLIQKIKTKKDWTKKELLTRSIIAGLLVILVNLLFNIYRFTSFQNFLNYLKSVDFIIYLVGAIIYVPFMYWFMSQFVDLKD
ncbi:hypothetical protein J2Z60_001927 [Lactobacillus colini]|uniref:Uncharacterized protein n=1 Tax=Lactobacillus colini TaxID=1819254 RepID=A0ABS4MGL2_9LACO|nr:hypothetical protein [Lactobacillus colini]MBP2058738.1 hypothetical protein [Lactobacillus colini]